MNEQQQTQQTRVIVTDSRVLMSGHSYDRAACVALSAAIQTFAYVALNLGLLAACVRIDPKDGLADVQLVEGERSRAAISGLMAAFHGIAKQCPGALLLADNRKECAEPLPDVADAESGSGSFAVAGETPRLAAVTKKIVLAG